MTTKMSPAKPKAPTYVINRNTESDDYSVWQLNTASAALFDRVETAPSATFPAGVKLCAVGGYLLSYDLTQLSADPATIAYDVFAFDPSQPAPLSAPSVQKGAWAQFKFWQYFNHYTWPPQQTDILELVPMTGYVLAFMPTAARGTYMLYNFDPAPKTPNTVDPLPNAIGPQDAFSLIGKGSELLPVGNYVLEWVNTESTKSTYRVWSFDPNDMHPLSLPYISTGQKPEIAPTDRLIVLGDEILQITPATGAFQLWAFDPQASDPFVGPVATGTLPQGFNLNGNLTAVQTPVPVQSATAAQPGTMDFMREKIEHVVVYMLESRSMDSVLGWLYEQDAPALNFVNAAPPFKGNSYDHVNHADGKTFKPYKFEGGKLSEDFVLAAPSIDPFHATSDSVKQQFKDGFGAYLEGAPADMGGFVSNNVSGEAMVTFSPEQLPVLHGLARNFAVSDEWFSPMPGGTTPNRAFALSGSNNNSLINSEGDPQYSEYADFAQRQPIWKVLQNNGITDWGIYYSVLWNNSVFTYELFLRNKLPSVDQNQGDYVQSLWQFTQAAAAGQLPKFSFLEPAWIAPSGATSYHPGASGDMVPAERTLYDIYQALANSPAWDKTAFVITFSKGGGLYDHVPTPRATPGWPHDENDGFSYDVFGPRVPTIIVSPLVKPHTVFRSGQDQPFDGTSLLSTLLDWLGIPRARWGLGDRVQTAPTFEAVFQLDTPRSDKPSFPLPYDKTYPPVPG